MYWSNEPQKMVLLDASSFATMDILSDTDDDHKRTSIPVVVVLRFKAIASLKHFVPKNGWLEDDPFLLGWPIFRGKHVSFRECIFQ